MLIAVSILMLAVELQFCLVVTARSDNRKYAREAAAVQRNELNQVAGPRREPR
jgi:hypothetical protein